VQIVDALISLCSFVAVVYLIQYGRSWELLTGRLPGWADTGLRLAAGITAAGFFWKSIEPDDISPARLLVDAGILAAMVIFYWHIRKADRENFKKKIQALHENKRGRIFAERRS
jgi:hypothetical protein